ncbi:hypothetical protein C0J52_15530 [Blattella germanica]|nr:hypothetical protein C0J52_15530 [Blattella germanica]
MNYLHNNVLVSLMKMPFLTSMFVPAGGDVAGGDRVYQCNRAGETEDNPYKALRPREQRFLRDIPIETWTQHLNYILQAKETRPQDKTHHQQKSPQLRRQNYKTS